MTDKPRILIVEDEPAIRTGLTDVFTYHGFVVTTATDGDAGWRAAQAGRFDLLLLDDRRAVRAPDDDVIHGLQLGADDYVAKPFSVAQLVLRVNAVLRRTLGAPLETQRFILVDGTVVDPSSLQGSRGATVLVFTRREMALLQYLYAQRVRAVSREELLQRVWGYANAQEIETRTVDIHIAKLRRKLEVDPADPRVLLTVRGAGYRLLGA